MNAIRLCLVLVLTAVLCGVAVAQDISSTPYLASSKGKIGQITAYTQARRADGTAITPVDGVCAAGVLRLISGVAKCQVQPLVSVYADEMDTDVQVGNGPNDIIGAVSLDDGKTWKRMNLSHSAEKSSIDINESPWPGDTRKPALSVAGRYILAAWTGKYCPSGDPSLIGEGTDLFLVKGQQNFVNYAEYERPDLGTVPFSCVWAARGMVDGIGNITWLAAEQLTSGRRDAYQLTTAAAGQAGFAMAWQEDPEGLRPGKAAGPGEGLSGATVSHKTDIWYSQIGWNAFKVDFPVYTSYDTTTASGDGRIKPSVAMSSPVPITDNVACRVVDGGINGPPVCEVQKATYCATITAPRLTDGKQFCTTADGRVLDGDTGASRPNLFLQAFKRADGTYGAETIIGYEESKGLGGGEEYDAEDIGKNVHYEHFANFNAPELMVAGTVLNLPEVDDKGNPIFASDGSLLYENARRIRFVLQPKSQMGKSGLALLALWKQGPAGQGRQSDIMGRRALFGYEESKFECTKWWNKQPNVCLLGTINLSSPAVLSTEVTEGDYLKVTSYGWVKKNLSDRSTANPYDDSRAHRGILRGDFLAIGFGWTANWAAARNGNDLYDLYLRRSFDGGSSWTDMNNTFQQPMNLSNLRPGQGLTMIEPRVVGTPNTITQTNPDGSTSPTGIADDVQNPMVFYVAYGTSTNPDLNVTADEEGELATPVDLFWSWTDNFGESFKLVPNNNDPTRMEFDWLAKIDSVAEGEAQLRVNPAGTKMYATWLGEGDYAGPCIHGHTGGSDMCFRKIAGHDPLAVYDVNDDRELTTADFELIQANICDAGCNAQYDFNSDGKVNSVDVKLWNHAYGVYQSQRR